MIDFVVRPLAGLLMCVAFGALILALPILIAHGRAWVAGRREAAPAPTLGQITPKSEQEQSEADRKAS